MPYFLAGRNQLRYRVAMGKKLTPGAALAAMRKTFRGKPKVLSKCPKCGKLCYARERRFRCPAHVPPAQ